MNRALTLFLSLAFLFVGLILADNLLSGAWYWKVGAALGLGILPWLFVRRAPAATPAAGATPAPATTARPTAPVPGRPSFLERLGEGLISLGVALAIFFGLCWLVWTYIVSPIVHQAREEPQTRVVSNGFTPHDTAYPPSHAPTFEKVLRKGQTYDVFEVKAGTIFKVSRMKSPVQIKVNVPGNGYDTVSQPGRHRAKQAGTLQVISPVDGNPVTIYVSN